MWNKIHYNKIHTIAIMNHDDLPINTQKIQYQEQCNYDKIIFNNHDVLINIKCEQLVLNG